jgi:hypothetical protein
VLLFREGARQALALRHALLLQQSQALLQVNGALLVLVSFGSERPEFFLRRGLVACRRFLPLLGLRQGRSQLMDFSLTLFRGLTMLGVDLPQALGKLIALAPQLFASRL